MVEKFWNKDGYSFSVSVKERPSWTTLYEVTTISETLNGGAIGESKFFHSSIERDAYISGVKITLGALGYTPHP